jgi:hypothetical protein
MVQGLPWGLGPGTITVATIVSKYNSIKNGTPENGAGLALLPAGNGTPR